MSSAFKSLKVEDVKELQELVAESVGAMEPGMHLLDTRVLLGGATIDILALDAEDRLTLIAVGLGADDEMLLRALEAYSWCLEYPDALRKLYPSVKLSENRPPRVIFVAERAPDAFMRKVKHLRLARAECLEFRFGLQFRAVEEVRSTDEPTPAARGERTAPAATESRTAASAERPAPTAERPAPPPAAPRPGASARPTAPPRAATRASRPQAESREVTTLHAPRPEPINMPGAAAPPRTAQSEPAAVHQPAGTGRRDATEPTRAGTAESRGAGVESRRDASTEAAQVHAQMLEQLRATTTTVGEWRDTKPPAEVDDERVRTVREYLQREFPTSVIYDFYAHDRGVQMFHLQDSHGALVHSAAVSEDLLDGASDAELSAFLDKHKLARVLRQAGSAGVSVTKSGLKIEAR